MDKKLQTDRKINKKFFEKINKGRCHKAIHSLLEPTYGAGSLRTVVVWSGSKSTDSRLEHNRFTNLSAPSPVLTHSEVSPRCGLFSEMACTTRPPQFKVIRNIITHLRFILYLFLKFCQQSILVYVISQRIFRKKNKGKK